MNDYAIKTVFFLENLGGLNSYNEIKDKTGDGNYDTDSLHKLAICNHVHPPPFSGGFMISFSPPFDKRGLPQSAGW